MAPIASVKKHEHERSIKQTSSDYIIEKPEGPWLGTRHVLTLLAFFGFFNVYCLRVNLSVAMVAMVNSTTKEDNATDDGSQCLPPGGEKNTTEIHNGDQYNWDASTQGILLGSFFYGYIVTQIPGGWLAEVLGGKKLFGYGVLCTAVLTLLTPLAAKLGTGVFIALRILEGLGEGVTFPAMHALLGKWAPVMERSQLAAFSYSDMRRYRRHPQQGDLQQDPREDWITWLTETALVGSHLIAISSPMKASRFRDGQKKRKLKGRRYYHLLMLGAQIGTVISMPLSGIMCDSDFLGGWPSVFYVFGAVACIWFIVWMVFAHDTPAQHPRISEAERAYIEKSVGIRQNLRPPWLAIFTSPAVWAICAAHFANNWGFYTMLTSLPTYLKNILKFDISQNGIVSAVPYLFLWFCQMISGRTADFVRRRGFLSPTVTRKCMTAMGLMFPGILMSCIGLLGCNHTAVVIMLTFAVGLGGMLMGGQTVNHLDLAPNFSGTLMGISNCLATIPGFVGPAIVGWITNGNQTRDQWQKVFYISAGVYLAGTIVYVLFGSGVEQPWNRPTSDEITVTVSNGTVQKVPPDDRDSYSSTISLGLDATSTTELFNTKL